MSIELWHGDCLELMKKIPDKSIDLVVTSPPYDNLRDYKGYVFYFEGVARELYRITKSGGVVVWIVGDATIKGNETGTSFKQALYYRDIGFNLHDTMIWNKRCFSAVGALQNRYAPVFEYMFIFSMGFPKTFNPIKDRKNKHAGVKVHGSIRNANGNTVPFRGVKLLKTLREYGQRFNIWEQSPQRQKGGHPAPFPEKLVKDHILSWSNAGDTVLDCFMGSGTTGVVCKELGRNFIGIEISKEYFEIAKKRIENTQAMML